MQNLNAQYTEPAPWRKPPQGGLTQAKKKKKRLILMEMILQIKNVSLVAKWGISAGNVLPSRDNKLCQSTPRSSGLVNKPCQSTPGSLGLDLSSTTPTILTPAVPVTLIPMGVADPLPEGIVGLVLGHSLLSFQGISVVSGVVDYDYTEKINVLVSPLCKLIKIKE